MVTEPTRAKNTLDIVLQGQGFAVAAERPEAVKFWKKAILGRWEADTFRFIQEFADHTTTFVDIGAWIGPMTLFASRHAGRVLALEPDPVAHKELVENILLNATNVDDWHVGIDNAEGHLTLYAPNGLGRSITSSLRSDGATQIQVPTVTFEQVSARIAGAGKVAVKIDIEGHEYRVIDNLVRFVLQHGASLHLSVHPRTYYENARRTQSRLAAKRTTWLATKSLTEKIAPLGTLRLSDSGRVLTTALLFQYIFLRTRVRNFSLEIAATQTTLPTSGN